VRGLGKNLFQILLQNIFSFAFEFHKHDSVAELRMTGDDETLSDDDGAIDPECHVKADADGERDHELNVATAAADVGGFETHGNVASLFVDFDGDMDGVAVVMSSFGTSKSGGGGLEIERSHE